MAKKRNEEAIKLLGRNIRKYRKAMGITMMELSYLMGVDYSQIANLELGKRDPSLTMILLAAKALNVSIAQLLSDPEEEN